MKRRAGITLILIGIVFLVIICSLPFFSHEQKVYEAAEIVLLDTDTQDILQPVLLDLMELQHIPGGENSLRTEGH